MRGSALIAAVLLVLYCSSAGAVRLRSQSEADVQNVLDSDDVNVDDLNRAWTAMTEEDPKQVQMLNVTEAGNEKPAYVQGQMKYGDCLMDAHNKIGPPAPATGLEECAAYEPLACCAASDAMDSIKIVRDRAYGLFSACPVCYQGFMALFCGAQCSPTQDSFMMIHSRHPRKVENVYTIRVCSAYCSKLYMACGGIQVAGVPFNRVFNTSEAFCTTHIETIGEPFDPAKGPNQNSTTIVQFGDDNCFDAALPTDCDVDHPFDPSGGGRVPVTDEQKDLAAAKGTPQMELEELVDNTADMDLDAAPHRMLPVGAVGKTAYGPSAGGGSDTEEIMETLPSE